MDSVGRGVSGLSLSSGALTGLFSLLCSLTAGALVAEKAYFAGGCFWCMEAPFEQQAGVRSAMSGYAGGREIAPSYKDVAAGKTGHVEAVEVVYDPQQITYEKLLDIFWRQIDPTDNQGQFVDRGRQYRPEIFYLNEKQRALAERSRRELAKKSIFNRPINTEITPFTTFYPAEDYHQDYYKKNPIRYYFYRTRSGRDKFLKKKWQGR